MLRFLPAGLASLGLWVAGIYCITNYDLIKLAAVIHCVIMTSAMGICGLVKPEELRFSYPVTFLVCIFWEPYLIYRFLKTQE